MYVPVFAMTDRPVQPKRQNELRELMTKRQVDVQRSGGAVEARGGQRPESARGRGRPFARRRSRKDQSFKKRSFVPPT